MNIDQAKELLKQITMEYFSDGTVMFAGTNDTVKKTGADLITIAILPVRSPLYAPESLVDGVPVISYPITLTCQIDLYTKGTAVRRGKSNQTVAMNNDAGRKLRGFMHFLLSHYVVDWCEKHDISITPANDVTDLTELVNETSYQYRAMLEISFDFTQRVIGYGGEIPESALIEDENGEWHIDPNDPNYPGSGSGSDSQFYLGYFTSVEIEEER